MCLYAISYLLLLSSSSRIIHLFILYSSCSSTGKYSNPEKCRITPLRRITPHRITPHNEMALAFKVCVCRNSFFWLLINFSFRFTLLPALSYLWISGSVILSTEVLSVKVPGIYHSQYCHDYCPHYLESPSFWPGIFPTPNYR